MTSHLMSQVLGLLIIFYLLLLLGIARYLKRTHESVWFLLGSPGFLNWSISSSFKLGRYVFLSGSYRDLRDKPLTYAIYSARFLIAVIAAFVIYWKISLG
jgi:hypothetical protein